MINIRRGDKKINSKSLIYIGVFVVGLSMLMAEYSFAQITDVLNRQPQDNRQFMIALTVFFLLTLFLIVWLLIKRQKNEKQFLQALKNVELIKNAILTRQESFYLLNENSELVLKLPLKIRFEDETVPDDMDDLKTRFTEMDPADFGENIERLLNEGQNFVQNIAKYRSCRHE